MLALTLPLPHAQSRPQVTLCVRCSARRCLLPQLTLFLWLPCRNPWQYGAEMKSSTVVPWPSFQLITFAVDGPFSICSSNPFKWYGYWDFPDEFVDPMAHSPRILMTCG